MTRKHLFMAVFALCTLVVLAACSRAPEPEVMDRVVVETVQVEVEKAMEVEAGLAAAKPVHIYFESVA